MIKNKIAHFCDGKLIKNGIRAFTMKNISISSNRHVLYRTNNVSLVKKNLIKVNKTEFMQDLWFM